jgi:alkaline phosphatase
LNHFIQRTDGLNLVDSLLAQNYQVVNDLSALSGNKKAAVFIADDQPVSYLEGRGDVLPNSIAQAIQYLEQNKNGFFMMVEGAKIDWAGEENDQEYLMAEMLDFDRAVGEALDFAEKDGNTLVIITGDHETGGYALTDGSVSGNFVQGQFVSLLHTGTMIPVFAFGPNEKDYAGVYENTAIFKKILNFYGLEP